MNSKYFPQLSSKKLKIIREREEKLIPKKVLNTILKQTYSPIQNKDKFVEIFDFSTNIYEQVSRKSGEKYTQHPLRILHKASKLGFSNFQLCSVLYAHDVFEIIRESPHIFSKQVEEDFKQIVAFNNVNLEILTPHVNLCKQLEMEEILKTLTFSTVPVPVPIITKIFDIHDNSYDQLKYKPNGAPEKLIQVNLAINYLKENSFMHYIINPNGIYNPILGYPLDLTSILKELLLDSKKNLLHSNFDLEDKLNYRYH